MCPDRSLFFASIRAVLASDGNLSSGNVEIRDMWILLLMQMRLHMSYSRFESFARSSCTRTGVFLRCRAIMKTLYSDNLVEITDQTLTFKNYYWKFWYRPRRHGGSLARAISAPGFHWIGIGRPGTRFSWHLSATVASAFVLQLWTPSAWSSF